MLPRHFHYTELNPRATPKILAKVQGYKVLHKSQDHLQHQLLALLSLYLPHDETQGAQQDQLSRSVTAARATGFSPDGLNKDIVAVTRQLDGINLEANFRVEYARRQIKSRHLRATGRASR